MQSEDKNVLDLVTVTYSDNELNDIANNRFTINELNNTYPIQCIRKCNDYQRIVYKGVDKFLILTYGLDGDFELCKIVAPSVYLNEVKSGINIGSTLDHVQSFDANGDYTFFYTGRTDMPKVSYHYTKDGYLVYIYYDDDNMVTKLEFEFL